MSAPSRNPFVADKPKDSGAFWLIVLAVLLGAQLPVVCILILMVAS